MKGNLLIEKGQKALTLTTYTRPLCLLHKHINMFKRLAEDVQLILKDVQKKLKNVNLNPGFTVKILSLHEALYEKCPLLIFIQI